MHLHPARDAPEQRRAAVFRKVVAVSHPDECKHAAQRRFIQFDRRTSELFRFVQLKAAHPGAPVQDLCRHLRNREDDVNHSRIDRVAEHVRVLRFIRILHDDETALLFDSPQTDGPVRSGPGEQNANRLPSVSIRQGPKQQIYRGWTTPGTLRFGKADSAVRHHQILRWRNYVDVIGFDLDGLGNLGDRYSGSRLEQRGKIALVLWREMQDDDICHPAVSLYSTEEFRERADAAGRCADPNNKELVL